MNNVYIELSSFLVPFLIVYAYINFDGTANIANLTIRLRSEWQIMVYRYQAIRRFNVTVYLYTVIYVIYGKSYQGRKFYDYNLRLCILQ